jgi:hypothetical protein
MLGWFGILSSVIYLLAQTELLKTVIPDFYVIHRKHPMAGIG